MVLNKVTKRERDICYLLFISPAVLVFFNFPAKYALISLMFISVFLSYFSDKRFRKIAFSFPMMIWLALTLYHVINAYTKNVPGVDAVDMLHGLKIYSCITIFAYWASIDLKKTVHFLTYCFIIRCLLVLFLLMFFPHANEDAERLTGAGGSATGLGQMAAITGIFIAYLNAFSKISNIKNICLFFVPIIVVFLTQSRNSLAMILISIFVSIVLLNGLKTKLFSIRTALYLCVFCLCMFIAYSSFNDTRFSQRFDTERLEESYFYQHNATGTFFDTIVGDRIIYYITGYLFFIESPITGIGMWNYKHLTGGEYPLHSEYMVHLCEGGIVAAVLWLTFIVSMFWIIFKYSPSRSIKIAALSSILVLLFCGIYAREFFYEIFYPAYGLILSFYFIKKWYSKSLENSSKN